MTLQVRGVHYDVGQHYEGSGPGNTRPDFDPADVAADMTMIAEQLHANAVRIAGTDLSRLSIAAQCAQDSGLAVWYSPFPSDLAGDDIVSYLVEAARIAEGLRTGSGPVVMVTGCELSLFCAGFLPGATLEDRLNALTSDPPASSLAAWFGKLPESLNATLGRGAAAIKDHFHGRLTYASAPWESVDWTPFDIVSADLYRDRTNAAHYRDILRSYRAFGKPVAVTEFGCCTYLGAADAGGSGFNVLDYDQKNAQWRLNTRLQRSEAEQSRYASELLADFTETGIHAAFWHTFAGWTFPHRPADETDLDLGSFGLVKVLDSTNADGAPTALEPKAVFWTLAETYGRAGQR